MDHKVYFSEMLDIIIDLTKNKKINWIVVPNDKKMIVQFIGDNGYTYTWSKEWKFDSYGWSEESPSFTITKSGQRTYSLWDFRFPNLKNLSEIIIENFFKEFKPKDDSVDSEVKLISTEFLIFERRNILINKINDSEST